MNFLFHQLCIYPQAKNNIYLTPKRNNKCLFYDSRMQARLKHNYLEIKATYCNSNHHRFSPNHACQLN